MGLRMKRIGVGSIPSTSGDWGERPTEIVALNEAGERYWITKIVLELNREVGLGLATAWSVGRTMSAVRRQAESVQMGRIFAIGASNAGYTAAALESKGVRTVSASVPGWRITRDNVEEVLSTVQKEYREGDILLIQCLENSIFFMLNTETGCMELPERGESDGIFHVTGKITVSKDMQLDALLHCPKSKGMNFKLAEHDPYKAHFKVCVSAKNPSAVYNINSRCI